MPTRQTIEIDKAKKSLSTYAKELNDDEVLVLMSDEKPVAAVVSLRNVDKESLSLSINPDFMEIILKSREEFKSGKKLSLEEMKKEVLGLD